MRSVSPRLFDGLQTSSLTLRNSMNAISVHVTIEIYILSLRSFISHYKATLFGRVHVLILQNKTSLLRFCTHTVISKLEHCTKSQWRYIHTLVHRNSTTHLRYIFLWARSSASDFRGRAKCSLGI